VGPFARDASLLFSCCFRNALGGRAKLAPSVATAGDRRGFSFLIRRKSHAAALLGRGSAHRLQIFRSSPFFKMFFFLGFFSALVVFFDFSASIAPLYFFWESAVRNIEQ
jgi:hypothetical protein